MKIKLAIISSHPIQYNAPMFALLANSDIVQPKVFYTWSQSAEEVIDIDFGKKITWDIPLLEGYQYEVVENVSLNPGPHHSKGIDCPKLNSIISNWNPDAILIYGWNYKAHLAAMKYFKNKIPVYFRGDSTLIDEKPGIKKIVRRLYLKSVYKNVDYAFYVGKNNKDYFLAHGLKQNELFFAPHAIDNKRFASKKELYHTGAQNWKKKLGISEQNIVILFVGKFEPKKNPILLLEAVKQINDKNIHLVFVGNGVLENELRKTSQEMENIHFVSFQNQSKIPELYYMSDIVALPSQGPGETWGLVINEAMACGKAVLVSDKAGCYRDLVENSSNGFVFTSGNLNSLKQAINQMNSKEKCNQMGANSLEFIKNWSFENIVKSIENTLIKNK